VDAASLPRVREATRSTAKRRRGGPSTKEATRSTAESTHRGLSPFLSGDTYSKGDKVYALEVITYSNAEGDWYVANKSWTEITESAGSVQDATITALNTTLGGGTDAKSWTGSGGAITGWTAAPEPTSGLLLLLGVAGLALRRRRA